MKRSAAPKISDEMLIRREIYNLGRETIFFLHDQARLQYVRDSGIAAGPHAVSCDPDGFCILNHGYYIAHTKSGADARVLQTFGDDIGKGRKQPSIPVVKQNGFMQ